MVITGSASAPPSRLPEASEHKRTKGDELTVNFPSRPSPAIDRAALLKTGTNQILGYAIGGGRVRLVEKYR
jgi:hypothetical protein